jgi:23S rRNA (uridine2552-2'-O)-methyltransferase
MKSKLGGRHLSQRLKTAKGRPTSSQRWLNRQLNDPYVDAAKRGGYRSRAAFKLIEIDDKLRLLKPGMRVLDLGAAPGGWTQVSVERTKAEPGSGHVVALDVQEMDPVAGATVLHLDFMAPEAPQRLREAIGGAVDVVLSDMAPPTMGESDIDHLRIMSLAEAALALVDEVLKPGGSFVTKLRQGSGEPEFFNEIRRRFAVARRIKPPASRPGSAEFFVVGTGFKGSGTR